MNREIKFRGWDKKENKMTEIPFCISNSGVAHIIRSSKEFNNVVNKFYKKNGDPLGGDFAEIDYTDWYAQNLEIMQFTGLKDKNGQEIYEGDIVKSGANKNGIVNFKAGCFMWRNEFLADDPECIDEMTWGNVIGNIFQNPELLG